MIGLIGIVLHRDKETIAKGVRNPVQVAHHARSCGRRTETPACYLNAST